MSRTAGQQKKAEFLAAFEDLGTITAACRQVGVGRQTVYDWRQADEDFAVALHDARKAVADDLEIEAIRRAKDGSDTLLIFLLKAHAPDRFRENVRVEHSGKIAHDTSGMSLKELERLADQLAD